MQPFDNPQEQAKSLVPTLAAMLGIGNDKASQLVIAAYYLIGANTLTDDDYLEIFGMTKADLLASFEMPFDEQLQSPIGEVA